MNVEQTDMLGEQFKIGDWLVEPQLNTIQKPGKAKRVEPKVMDLLVFFARNQGRLLERGYILDEVWSDAIVTENALHFAVVGLRKALEDDAKSPRYIQTVPKRGYRRIAPVESVQPPGSRADTETVAGTLGKRPLARVAAVGVLGIVLVLTAMDRAQNEANPGFASEPVIARP